MVRPRGSGNIGSVARAMKNFGASELAIVGKARTRSFWARAMPKEVGYYIPNPGKGQKVVMSNDVFHAGGGHDRPRPHHSSRRRPAAPLRFYPAQIGTAIDETKSPASPKRERVAVCLIPCSNLMPSMMVATVGITLPEIRESFSLSEVAAGSLFSVMMILAALTSAGAGRLADRIGPKKVLIAGLTLLGLGFAAAGMAVHLLGRVCRA